MPERTRRRSARMLVSFCALIAIGCSDQTTAPEPPPPANQPPTGAPPAGPERNLSTNLLDEVVAATISGSYVYVVGATAGSLDLPSRGGIDVIVRKYHPEGEMLWGRQFGTSESDWGMGAAADRAGNLYLVGYTDGSLAGNRGGRDAYVRKYSPAGTVLWTRQFGSADTDVGTGIAVDSAGDIYVAGFTVGQFDGGASVGGWDVFLRKYSASGTVLWHRQWGTAADDQANGVAADAAGNTYLVGFSEGGTFGAEDAFIRSYDASGAARWTRWAGTPADDRFTAVTLDVNANPVAAGTTLGAVVGVSAGGMDSFLRRYSKTGATLFTAQFGTSETDLANSVSADGSGCVVAGYTLGDLAGQVGGADGFVRKYGYGNTVLWTRQFGTESVDVVQAVAGLQSSRLYVGGYTNGSFVGANLGISDAYLRRLDSNGNPVWTDQ